MSLTPPESGEEKITRLALERPKSERTEFVETACAGDATLLHRVAALLRQKQKVEAEDQGTAVDINALRQRVGAGLRAQAAVGGEQEAPSAASTAASSREFASEERPGTIIGRYRLLEKIGEGGFGSVYVAEQKEPVKRRVALKLIKLGMDTRQVVARFEAERQALAMMDHPNIAKVLDGGATDSGRPYFVMELVRGVAITRYCDENNLSTEKRLDLFIQTCQAIQHAHQKGIIHRDIKPSNILVTSHDGQPVPKVIDFGIAKATQGELTDKTVYTQFQQFIGTPAFVSPEQAEMTGMDIDTRSDIYSLGVLLYELLVGKTPFDTKELLRAGLDAMRKAIREQEPVRPSTRLGNLSQQEQTITAKRRSAQALKLINLIRGDLDWIVMKCLEKDRTLRYDTANELGMDVERFLRSEPVTACPPSASYRFRKLVRRNKVTFAAAAAVTASLVFGLGLSSWLFIQERRARQEQVQLRQNAVAASTQARLETKRAEAAAAEVKNALAASDFLRAIHLIAERKDQDALAYLVRCLRNKPSHEAAAARLATLLMYRSWFQPLSSSRKLGGQISLAQFSPDGKWVVTSSADTTVRVWDVRTGQALTAPLNHNIEVYSTQLSPDGKRLLTYSGDHTAQLWDVQTSQPLTEPLTHTDGISSAQFSSDGNRVITGSRDKTAQIWDAHTGKPLTQPLKHTAAVDSAQFSPDGKRVVTASEDAPMQVWDALTGLALTEPLKNARLFSSAQFSPDADRVVTASGNTARVWDAQSGRPLTEPMMHARSVISAQFSPDGKRVLTVSVDRAARVWDAFTGQPLTQPLKHPKEIQSAQFSPESKRVLTVSEDNTARVWDALTGRPLAEPLKQVLSAQFSPDGRTILSMSLDSAVRVWDAQAGQSLTEPLKQAVYSARFSPDGKRVVTSSLDNTARVWDARTGRPLTEPLRHGGSVYSARFSPDGKRVVTASDDKTALVWDAQTGQPLTKTIEHSAAVASAQFSPDGKRVVTASADNTARVWDAQTGLPLIEPLEHEGKVNSAQFSNDGRWLVTASGNAARVWDAQSGQPLTGPLRHVYGVSSAEFSSDGSRVVTSGDKTARVWNALTGILLAEPLRHAEGVVSAQFSPDGKRVVTASADNTARVWDAQTGLPLIEPLEHEEKVNSAQFSMDGKRVATASDDKTARIWDAQTGQPLTEPLRYPDSVHSAEFSPDGSRVVTASDRIVRVWDLCPRTEHYPGWLVDLAEATSGEVLNFAGVLEPVEGSEILKKTREAVEKEPIDGDWGAWGRWFLADPSTRTISPFSKLSIPEWIEIRIREGTTNALIEAEHAAASTVNTNALAQIERSLVLGARWVSGDALFLEGKFVQAEVNYREGLTNAGNLLDTLPVTYSRVVGSLAAALFAQGKHAEAEKFLEEAISAGGVKVDQLAMSMGEKGNTLARYGHKSAARTAFAKAIRINPVEHANWYRLAPLLAESGAIPDYDKHRHEMLERFRNATNAPLAERTAKACLLLPAAQTELEVVSQLAERAVTIGANDGWVAYYQFAKCLAEYRVGKFANAVELAQKALATLGVDHARDTEAYSVLAMSLYGQSHFDEARAALANAVEIAKTKLPSLDGPDLGDSWHEVLIADILMREAKAVIWPAPSQHLN